MTDIKYYPHDENRFNTSLGIKLPMNGINGHSSDKLFNLSYSTEEQSVSNYINLLLTIPGERWMQPEYGIGIQRKLFEQITIALKTDIEDDIRIQCGRWLPYINNISIDVDTTPKFLGTESENGILIRIIFKVTESGANKTMSIFNKEGRTFVQIV
jgi:phage baseplate assembly protein W